jgi:hypothetical protein
MAGVVVVVLVLLVAVVGQIMGERAEQVLFLVLPVHL